MYSHLTYDIVPDDRIVVRRPDVLIVEGLNVLQPPSAALRRERRRRGHRLLRLLGLRRRRGRRRSGSWYVERFLRLRETAFADPDSYFHRYAALTDERGARRPPPGSGGEINEPNLVENILPTRARATLVLTKGADHAVTRIRLRKI